MSFTLGVLNIAVTAFLCGRFPEYFWLWHTLKSVTLTSLQASLDRAIPSFRQVSRVIIANLFRGPVVLSGVQVVWTPAPVLHARPVLGHHSSGRYMGRGRVLYCRFMRGPDE